ncbi:MAG TPA: hypothetical protein VKW06_10460 [Candidatus Angelobacter sp.]|nr:hypothetical protein [Candidatus Angelobacter sp.]
MKHLRKLLMIAAIAAAAVVPAIAQTITTVTGTVVDPSGVAYSGGTVLPQFVNVSGGASPTVTANGSSLVPPTTPGILNSSGTFSVNLIANASISPASTHWQFLICSAPAVGYPDPSLTGPQCFTTGQITISGSNQNITTNINAVPPPQLVIYGPPNGTAGLAGFSQFGNTVRLTSDFTTSSASLVAISNAAGNQLLWTLPSLAMNWSFHCDLAYSQATAAAANAFGIQAATNAATRIDASGTVYTAAAVSTSADLTNLTTTTATNIVTFTPSATGTVFHSVLEGTIQASSSPPTVNIMVLTGNASDAITVKAGSYCAFSP